jgi:transcriptional regulator with XRE-family HTH domain
MARRGDPGVLRYVVNFLRFRSGMTQMEFGRACRVNQAEISRFELGKLAPSEEQLRRMAVVSRVEWPLVAHVRHFYTVLLRSSTQEGIPPMLDLKCLEPVLLAVAPFLVRTDDPEPVLSPEEERSEAVRIWTALDKHPVGFRAHLIAISPRSGSWALAEQACKASIRKAAHSVGEALELAELALSIAERVPGQESWRSRLRGYCLAHKAHGLRIANKLAESEEGFARAWALWRAGADPDALLPEWLLLAMEASLRRAQRRFPEALDLLDRAVASPGGTSPEALPILLLEKEHVFNQMGDMESAFAALAEAAPLVEAAGDHRLFFALRFNMADNLCHLGRYEEAAQLLPLVRELAIQQANELDLIRVGWLTAKVAAGEGRAEEAIAGLEQVRRDFTARELPYNAALSSLDLCALLLQAGRTVEVKEIAVAMAWIFKAQGIGREALAALSLFCDAAVQESASVELARRVIKELEQVKRSV